MVPEGAPVVTVEADAAAVEARLAAAGLSCPGCGAVLVAWGHARARVARGPDGLVRVRPRRSRCRGCGVTHVLLPVGLLLRRADAAVVVGSALTARAAGLGFRRIAVMVGRPAETVRGWLRRFAGRLEAVRAVFTRWLRVLDPDPVMPAAAGGGWPDAVAAIVAAAAAVARRFMVGVMVEAPVWQVAVAVSGGRLLAPGWPDGAVQHELTLTPGKILR